MHCRGTIYELFNTMSYYCVFICFSRHPFSTYHYKVNQRALTIIRCSINCISIHFCLPNLTVCTMFGGVNIHKPILLDQYACDAVDISSMYWIFSNDHMFNPAQRELRRLKDISWSICHVNYDPSSQVRQILMIKQSIIHLFQHSWTVDTPHSL